MIWVNHALVVHTVFHLDILSLFHLRNTLLRWGRVTHICVGNLTIIASDNGLSPCRRQAIISTNDGILLIGPLRTNCSEIRIAIQNISYIKMLLKMSVVKWQPICLGFNVRKITTQTEQCHCIRRLMETTWLTTQITIDVLTLRYR